MKLMSFVDTDEAFLWKCISVIYDPSMIQVCKNGNVDCGVQYDVISVNAQITSLFGVLSSHTFIYLNSRMAVCSRSCLGLTIHKTAFTALL